MPRSRRVETSSARASTSSESREAARRGLRPLEPEQERENCYGPFNSDKLDDARVAFDWLGPKREERTLYAGWLDSGQSPTGKDDLVTRLETYVSERDLFGLGFSDNIIHHDQCYVQARLLPKLRLAKHVGEDTNGPGLALKQTDDQTWLLPIEGPGFKATFGIQLSFVPEVGERALV